MSKNKVNNNVGGLLVFTLVTLSAWVGFELFRALVSSTPEQQQQQGEIVELDPTLETKVLDILEQKHP